jgi:hypothetical protein
VDPSTVREDHRDDVVAGVGVPGQGPAAVGDRVGRVGVDRHQLHEAVLMGRSGQFMKQRSTFVDRRTGPT